jgi:hypothetical protein
MPARHHILTILAFWLLTSAWLLHRDIWPRLQTKAPPPAIDLADEAQGRPVRWTVFQGQRRAGYAQTGVRYHEEDDTFTIWGILKLWTRKDLRGQADRAVESHYRVTRDGEVRALSADVSVALLGLEAKGRIEGSVEQGRFVPHVEVSGPMGTLSRDLNPVTVPRRGSILNPLLPVNRLWGLKPGQRWRVPILDPLAEALLASVKGETAQTRFIEAEVRSKTEELKWDPSHPPMECLIIDYSGDDISGQTWVRRSDGLVLVQEMSHAGEVLALRRDP